MKRRYPDILALRLVFKEESFSTVVRAVQGSIKDANLPEIKGWSIPASGRFSNLPVQQVLDKLKGPKSSIRNITMKLADNNHISIFKPYGEEYLQLSSDIITKLLDDNNYQERLEQLVQFSKLLASQGLDLQGTVTHNGTGAECLPYLPLVEDRSNIVIASKPLIEQYFKDYDEFLTSGWTSVELARNIAFCARALDFSDHKDFLEKTLDHQWILARILKPGNIEFFVPNVLPEERSIYRSGKRVLDTVGYDRDKEVLELSCGIIGKEAHINGWEIFDIWGALEKGKLPDKSKLKEVHVIFIDQDAAEGESTPLLDAGARVFYYDLDGRLIEILAHK